MHSHRMFSLRLKSLAVLIVAALLSPCLKADTDQNGFFTEYLVAGAYAGPGCNPNDLYSADFLCDGDNSENTILPEDGDILFPPVTEAEDCEGSVPAALFGGFHANAMLDLDGNLPIAMVMTNGDLLDFESHTPGADNAMGYAWVYVENITDAPLNYTMGVASDDTIQVKINRVEVFHIGVCRGWGGAGTTQNTFPVTLQPGGNLVQFKVWDGGGGWGMRARFESQAGCGAIRSGDGEIIVGIDPIDIWEAPATRSVILDGMAPAEVTASVSVAVNVGGAYNLEENFDRAWTASDVSPEPTASEEGRLYWEGITAANVSYTLTRTGPWTRNTLGGTVTVGETEFPVGGATQLSSGLVGHVSEVLVTPSFAMMGAEGCSVSATQMDGTWIDDSDEINDETIIPEEGLIFGMDFEGIELLNGFSPIGFDAEANFLDLPGDPFSESILVRATSADGFYDWQRADIFAADVSAAMCIAFFYAINDSDEPIRVGIGFGSDDSGSVRVNGRPVITTPRCAGHPGFTDKGTAQLDPGKNLVSVYTFENGGGWNMCVRFEDENGDPLPIPTTIDPEGYEPGEEAHPNPDPVEPGGGDAAIHNSPFLSEALFTPAFNLAQWDGCNIPPDAMRAEWISDVDNEVSDEFIIPEDGLIFRPDFGGNAPEISGMTILGAGAIERFWTLPQDQFDTEAVLVPGRANNGIYDLQRGDLFEFNVERCMCVAYVYVINESEEGRCIQLGVGSDDSLAVKVNGRYAGGYQRCAPHNPFDQKIPVWLDPGKNLIALATYEAGGGYIMCMRFEDENGALLSMPHTIDPTGYNPEDHGDPPENCSNAPGEPAPYMRGGPGKGFITEWLVPVNQFESATNGTAPPGALIEDYVSQGGGPPEIDNIFAGTIIEAGVSGLVTTGVRNSACGFTTLARASAFDINPGDPGLFNGESYYGGGDQYTAVMFTFVENLTDDDLEAWFGFSSDDGATLFVNGEVVAEHLATRGFGGVNEIQNRATSAALLEPGLNLVMLGYNEAGGGSGGRIAMFSDSCFNTPFTEEEVSVSADNPEIDAPGGGGPVRGVRDVEAIDCEGVANVTITFEVPGDQAINVEMVETLPEGLSGQDPSQGEFNANGSQLIFRGEVSNGDSVTYIIPDAQAGSRYCLGAVDGNPITGDNTMFRPLLRRCPEICDNELDDDRDGAIDCDDTDCADVPACTGLGQPEICNNGLDDDLDGAIDCVDRDCLDDASCLPDEICDNGLDDDRDGNADCDDTDCADAANCQVAKGPTFVRGDGNSDGSINLTDGVVPLLYLFSGGAAPACADAADTNDTGGIEITDAIIIFGWLFTGGAAPAEPSPLSPGYSREECGPDATEDGIGCDRPSPVCP